MNLTPLYVDQLPGLGAESHTVTDGDEIVGWVVRHPHGPEPGWKAIDLRGSVVDRGLSHRREAVAALTT